VSLEFIKAAGIVVVLAGLWLLEGLVPMFGRRRHRLRHDAVNVGLGLINAAVVAVVFAWALVKAAQWAQDRPFGLLNWLDAPVWVEWVLVLVLFDLWMYGWHVANHRVPILWRFHQVHHADADLDASSALRFHTGEIALSSIARLGIVPLLGMTIPQLLVYELILQPIILLHHSNVRFPEPLDRALRLVIVTPRIHWVHHSKIRAEHDANYASVFSWWDRLFRTLRWKKPPEIDMGLQYTGPRETSNLLTMLALPFRPLGRGRSERKAPSDTQARIS
jgi:sterol desaturase/sphingolipid hydroxylase (fatty acid hydroxylase superfamily)